MTAHTETTVNPPARQSVRAQLEEWFASNLGRSVLASVLLRLIALLPTLFGYHILQLGVFRDKPLMAASRISHQVIISIDREVAAPDECGVHGEADALPVATDSVDVVLLPFVLEFENDPHAVLREVERILIAEGHVVIVGFNPLSCWGIWRLLLSWRESAPWSGRFLRVGRLKDWLKLLGFEVSHVSRTFFRPPLRSHRLLRNLGFLEMLGRKLYPILGGVYVIVARKRLQRLIPIRTQWRVRRNLITTGLVEPTAFEITTHEE